LFRIGFNLFGLFMINKRYILFNSTPILKDKQGRYTCDPFWAKDLRLHLGYISKLVLCCPVIETDEKSDMPSLIKMISYNFGALADITDDGIEIIALNPSIGWLQVFKNLVPNFLKVKHAISTDCIVHSDAAGWPFPISFYLLPLKFFYKFKWIVVMESTFWAVKKGDQFSIRKWFTHTAHQLLLPHCLKNADARIFTHTVYKNMFISDDTNVHISEYSNLDNEFLVDEAKVKDKFLQMNTRSMRFLLAGRLIPDKGIQVLLNAVSVLREKGVKAQIDVMGSGELEQACRDFAAKSQGSVVFSFVETVPYGKPFFELLSTYDVLLLANLTEEQPRIVLDAFGQGLSIVASDTEGLKTICKHQHNSIVFKTGDVNALAEAITYAVNHPSDMLYMGLEGLKLAQTKTHQRMHEDRASFLDKTFKLVQNQ